MIGSRPAGVGVSKSQLATEDGGPPLTVQYVATIQPIAVRWFDENGRGHDEVWFKQGDIVYQPPNSEEWAGMLRPVKPTLADQINKMMRTQESTKAVIPTDSVDVMDGDSSDEAPAAP